MLQTRYLLNCKQPDVFQLVETVVQILATRNFNHCVAREILFQSLSIVNVAN